MIKPYRSYLALSLVICGVAACQTVSRDFQVAGDGDGDGDSGGQGGASNSGGGGPSPCDEGFELVDGMCEDIDECASDNGGCDPLVTCSNEDGSFTCGDCPSGYEDDGGACLDINECLVGDADCTFREACINTEPGFDCVEAVISIASGSRHSCLIYAGRLFCWGNNVSAAVGDGTGDGSANMVPEPKEISNDDDWTKVVAGSDQSCALKGTGELYCWGNNVSQRLGVGLVSTYANVPERVGTWSNWDDLSVGSSTTCGLRDGALYCWGGNLDGKAGVDAATSTVTSPTQLGTETDWSQVSVGDQHTCGIRAGQLYCWGRNRDGQLGFTGDTDAHSVPTQVGSDADWINVVSSNSSTCAINESGELYCWGDNQYGQLGLEDLDDRSAPEQVGTDSDWRAFGSAYSRTICAIKSSGTLFCTGAGTLGQLGNAKAEDALSPVQVGTEGGWTAVTQGSGFACGIQDGQAYCWGNLSESRLGGSVPDDTILKPFDEDAGWTDLSIGGAHACGIKDTDLYCWGSNSFGQIGDDTSLDRPEPRLINSTWDWTAVAAGSSHSCALRSTGTVYCWGRNNAGQLGKNNNTDTEFNNEPGPTFGTQGYASVTAGGNGTCALRGGQPFCWGGYSLVDVDHAPTAVDAGTSWSHIVTSSLHTCGINGSNVECFGYNNAGQVGTGDGVDSPALEPVGGAGGWSEVVVTGYGTCGVRSGNLLCWGGYGLGTADVPSPVGGAGWAQLSGGGEYVCGYRSGDPMCLGGRFEADIAAITPASVTNLSVGGWGVCGLVDGQLHCMRHLRVEPSEPLEVPPG